MSIGATVPGMRLLAYLRVSTDRQAEEGLGEEGLGLDVQEQAIRRWLKANDIAWSASTGTKGLGLQHEGVSGFNGLDDRLGLADAWPSSSSAAPTGSWSIALSPGP